MEKKRFYSAVAVLSAALAALIVSSCSSECAEEEQIDYTLSQKEKIEKLAEEYGLHIEAHDDFSTTRAGDEQDLEDEMAMMASLAGQYDLIGDQNGDSLAICGYNSSFMSPLPNISSSYESGTASLPVTHNEQELWRFIICVSLSWDITYYSNVSITGVNVQEVLHGNDNFTISYSNVTITRTGEAPGTIHFACQVIIRGSICNYMYHLSGDYTIATASGVLLVD